METVQLTGPFIKGRTYKTNVGNAVYVQIGIEVGEKIPLPFDDMEPDISINGINMRISDNCMLEWDNFTDTSLTFVPLRNLKEQTIIDIAYE